MLERKIEAPGAGTPGVFSGQNKSNCFYKLSHQRTRDNSNFSSYSFLNLHPDMRRVSSSGGGEYAGPCPFCGGKDRFRCWPAKGRAWCRQCGWKGDAIQLLRDRDGLSFTEAKRALGLSIEPASRQAIAKQRAKSAALTAAHDTYKRWAQYKLTTLADEYRELQSEKEVIAI